MEDDLLAARSETDRLSAPAPSPPGRPASRWTLVALSTAVLLLIANLVYLRGSRPAAPPEASVPAEAALTEAGVDSVVSSDPQPAAVPATEPEPVAPKPDPLQAGFALEAWADAWSGQRVDDYLSHYAPGFQPPNGLTREEWEAQRRERLLRPKSIRVTLTELRIEPLGEDRVRAVFQQAYQSDTFGDSVRKTTELVWDGDRWKIAAELSQ